MPYQIEFEQEVDGRWIAEIPDLPGVMAYGVSRSEAESKVEVMATSRIADQPHTGLRTSPGHLPRT